MKKIIIIGGGISGLSAGVFAELNGYESTILEKNTSCGGECIGWTRDNCYIDGCIHWLTGTKENTKLSDLWKQIGALDNVDLIKLPYFYIYRQDDIELIVDRDINKFKQNLLNVAPEDETIINEFIGYIEKMQGIEPPTDKPMDMMGISDYIKLGKSMGKYMKTVSITSKISISEYAEKCHSEYLKGFLTSYMPGSYSLMAFVTSLATFMSGNGEIPNLRSSDFSERILEKYLSLGGKIIYNKTVKELITENKQITKAICLDGSEYIADYFIPTADADVVYHKLLNNKYNDPKFETRYKNEKAFPIIANCYFAYSLDSKIANKLPDMIMMQCDCLTVANKEISMIGLKNYSYFDNGNGLTTLIAPLLQDGEDYKYWEKLYNDKAAYKKEKERVGMEIARKFSEKYPEAAKLKLIDTATPYSYTRYLGAYKGAYMAFMMTPKQKQLNHNGKIKGLKNCFMAGQWLMTPGGLPSALVTGKFAIQRICKNDKKEMIY